MTAVKMEWPAAQRDANRPAQDHNVLEAQWDRFMRAASAQSPWAEGAARCSRFVLGEQYDPGVREALLAQGRPALTLNHLSAKFRLMSGYFRGHRRDIRYLPGADGTGDAQIANILTKLSKHTDARNQSKSMDALVFEDGLVTGRGFWDVSIDYTDNALGEVREVRIDPFSVFIDPDATSPDPNDWNFVSVSRWMSLDDMILIYGPAAAEVLDINTLSNGPTSGAGLWWGSDEGDAPRASFGEVDAWARYGTEDGPLMFGAHAVPLDHALNRARKLVRVIDSQYRVLRRMPRFVDRATGQTRRIPPHWDRNRVVAVIEHARAMGADVQVEMAVTREIMRCVTAVDRVLHHDWSPYPQFTVVPYFPMFRDGITRGMMHDLIDPQIEINRMRSAGMHAALTTAHSGWMVRTGSLSPEGLRALVERGSQPGIVIEHDGEAPQRITPLTVPQAYAMFERASTVDLKEISGITDSAMGAVDKVQSGYAIEARQRQTLVATEVYFDSFALSLGIKGRARLGLYQTFYTQPRLFRLQDEDDPGEAYVPINSPDAAGQIINGITTGAYEVTVDTAPAASTFSGGVFAAAVELAKMGLPIGPDVLLEHSNLPNKAKILAGIKKAQEEKAQQPAPGAQEMQAKTQGRIAEIQAKGAIDAQIATLKAQHGANPPDPTAMARLQMDMDLRLRELALRERELALAEQTAQQNHARKVAEDMANISLRRDQQSLAEFLASRGELSPSQVAAGTPAG